MKEKKEQFDTFLKTHLNKEQKKAVLHKKGPLMIIAGPGTGKTRTLTHRIAYLVKEKKVSPENILAVTFTNKAAQEMRERLEVLIRDVKELPLITTFHSLCFKILQEQENIPRLSVIDDDERKSLILEVLKDIEKKGIDINEKPQVFLDKVVYAKQQIFGPDENFKKTNGEIDVQYADTQDVKKSLLANAKQNKADDKLLRQLAKLELYEILEDDKWLDYKIKKTYGTNNYETPLFNPSYTSPISMYNMIERKLRNHATRKYPKNFNHKEVSVLYEDTYDEKYNKNGELITAEERVEITTKEVEDKMGTTPVFEKEVVKGAEVVGTVIKKVEKDDRPPLKVEEPIVKEKEVEIPEIVKDKVEVFKEEKQEEKTQQSETDDDDLPDWMN